MKSFKTQGVFVNLSSRYCELMLRHIRLLKYLSVDRPLTNNLSKHWMNKQSKHCKSKSADCDLHNAWHPLTPFGDHRLNGTKQNRTLTTEMVNAAKRNMFAKQNTEKSSANTLILFGRWFQRMSVGKKKQKTTYLWKQGTSAPGDNYSWLLVITTLSDPNWWAKFILSIKVYLLQPWDTSKSLKFFHLATLDVIKVYQQV